MKILITGGREYDNDIKMHKVLEMFKKASKGKLIIVHGNAKGADRMARDWAKANNVKDIPYPIENWEWEKYGKGAGPKRNHRMLQENLDIDCVLAFPDPKSRGTYDMTERATVEGIPTKIYK